MEIFDKNIKETTLASYFTKVTARVVVWKQTLKRDWARDEKNEYRRRQID